MNIEEYKSLLKENRALLILIALAVVTLMGSSYAWYSVSFKSNKEQTLTAGTLSLTLNEKTESITLTNAVPQSDEDGLENTPYNFSLTNNGTLSSSYSIYLDDLSLTASSTRLSDSFIKYNIQEKQIDTGTKILAAQKDRKIIEGVIDAGETIDFSLRIWVSEEATASISGQEFRAKLRIEGNQVKNNPNPPELVGDMIPVIYDESTSNWVKSSTNSDEWYNYDNQMWANAVTIKDETKRNTYKNANVGTKIEITDINTFFVWIPRYSYTLGNTYGYKIEGASEPSIETPGAFDIKFISKDKIDNGSGQYTGNQPKNYYTPSSFCWGDTCDDENLRTTEANKELAGIWISKFKITGTKDNISSLPNNTMLRSVNIADYFNSIHNTMNGESASINYGFKGNYDTHMIKNTEWGAMAYLSQSKYGKYGNKNYTGANKEIYQNKSPDHITGYSNKTPGTTSFNQQVAYNISIDGTGASTTGTINGIYDTTGSAAEYVMANFNNQVSGSGFVTMPSRKYYNLYTESNISGSIKGDAYGKDGTNGFYSDYVNYVNTRSPWAYRGGWYNDNASAGIFLFWIDSGAADINSSTRFVLVPIG